MAEEGVITETEVSANTLIDVDPAPAADEQKTGDTPATDADEQKTEAVETPEQVEQRKESRRARSNARKAAELAAAQTEARMLREQLDRMQQGSQKTDSIQEPRRDQFEDYESYLRAVTRYDAQQVAETRLKETFEASQKNQSQQALQQAQQKVAQNWVKREAEFQKANPDYMDVVSPFVEEELDSLSQQARFAVTESDSGPKLLYHLASNPDIAERIAKLSPLRQVAELGKLEDKLAAVPAKKVSSAPEPITPVKAGRSSVAGFNENMSDSEYREWRKSQGARWANR